MATALPPLWEEAVARALTDQRFRAALLQEPAEMLRDYGIKRWEEHLLQDLRPQSLAQLITYLRRINHLPTLMAARWGDT